MTFRRADTDTPQLRVVQQRRFSPRAPVNDGQAMHVRPTGGGSAPVVRRDLEKAGRSAPSRHQASRLVGPDRAACPLYGKWLDDVCFQVLGTDLLHVSAEGHRRMLAVVLPIRRRESPQVHETEPRCNKRDRGVSGLRFSESLTDTSQPGSS
jgi:hypothetical protein